MSTTDPIPVVGSPIMCAALAYNKKEHEPKYKNADVVIYNRVSKTCTVGKVETCPFMTPGIDDTVYLLDLVPKVAGIYCSQWI